MLETEVVLNEYIGNKFEESFRTLIKNKEEGG